MKINKHLQTIVAPVFQQDKPHKRVPRNQSKRLYYLKNQRAAKKILNHSFFLREFNPLYFVTITTYQHYNGLSDKQARQVVSNWFKKLKIDKYILVCEAQRNTGDLHFHIILHYAQDLQIAKEAKYFSNRYHSSNPAAIFDIKRINLDDTSLNSALSYVVSYQTKKSNYSTLFYTNTYSISKTLQKIYKSRAYEVELKVEPHSVKEFLKVKKKTPFFVAYEYGEDIWHIAQNQFKQSQNLEMINPNERKEETNEAHTV